MKNPFVKFVVVLIAGILGYAIMGTIHETGRNKSRRAAYDSYLFQMADSMNKKLPMWFDAETRLDKLSAGSGQLTYFFSLPNLTKTNLDLPVLQSRLRENVTINYKTNSNLETDRQNNILMKYQYKDKNGDFLFEIAVSPKDF
jgi:hypothetical protein